MARARIRITTRAGGSRPSFRPLKQQVVGNVGSVLWVVMATVGLVMLIACTNVANLLLVRAESRQQELSIRAALGAGRARIARELLMESVSLGLMGGVLAIGVAYAGLRLLTAIGPADLPRLSEISLDCALAWFHAASFGSFGIAVRIDSGAEICAREGATAMIGSANRTASAGRARQRSRNVLVVAQVAMALVLLVSALLMIRTFAALRNVEPGFADAAHVQTMRIWIPDLLVPDPQHGYARCRTASPTSLRRFRELLQWALQAPCRWTETIRTGTMIAVEGKHYEGGDAAPQAVQLRLAGIFHDGGHAAGCGARLYLGRHLRSAADGDRVGEFCARIVGLGLGR